MPGAEEDRKARERQLFEKITGERRPPAADLPASAGGADDWHVDIDEMARKFVRAHGTEALGLLQQYVIASADAGDNDEAAIWAAIRNAVRTLLPGRKPPGSD